MEGDGEEDPPHAGRGRGFTVNTVLLTENQSNLDSPPSLPLGSAFLLLSIGNVLFLLYIGKTVYVMNVKTAGNLNTVFIFVYHIYKKDKK